MGRSQAKGGAPPGLWGADILSRTRRDRLWGEMVRGLWTWGLGALGHLGHRGHLAAVGHSLFSHGTACHASCYGNDLSLSLSLLFVSEKLSSPLASSFSLWCLFTSLSLPDLRAVSPTTSFPVGFCDVRSEI